MPAESHMVSTAADLASQVRTRRVDPVAITSATLARIASDSRAVAAFRHVRYDDALAEAADLAERSDLGELALAGVPVAVKEVAAIAGEYPAWESLSTAEPFGFDSDVVERLRAAGAVVIGTTRDPATPYRWAVALAHQLDSGVLVSRDGDGHTGYHQGNTCVDGAVESYLVSGVVPHDGLSC